MLYFLFVCGILLFALSIYALFKIDKQKDNPNYKKAKIATWLTLILGATFIIIPRSVWKVEKAAAERNAAKKTTYELNNFKEKYTEKARSFNAKTDFDWIIKNGEKGDTITLQINSNASVLISLKQNQKHEVAGIFVMVGNDHPSDMLEALYVIYSIISVFETDRNADDIPDFVTEIFNQPEGTKFPSKNITYSVSQVYGNTVLSILVNK